MPIPGVPPVDAQRPAVQSHPDLARMVEDGGGLGGQHNPSNLATPLRLGRSVEQHPPVVRGHPDQVGGQRVLPAAAGEGSRPASGHKATAAPGHKHQAPGHERSGLSYQQKKRAALF